MSDVAWLADAVAEVRLRRLARRAHRFQLFLCWVATACGIGALALLAYAVTS